MDARIDPNGCTVGRLYICFEALAANQTGA